MLAFAICDPLLASSSTVATAAQAKAFLQSIYQDTGLPPPRVNHIGGDQLAQFFDPSLVALLRENARLTPEGQESGIDFDPICWCQSDKGLKAKIGAIRLTSATTAKAVTTLEYRGEWRTRMQFELVTVNGQWRIHDIYGMASGGYNAGSFRQRVIQSIRALNGHP